MGRETVKKLVENPVNKAVRIAAIRPSAYEAWRVGMSLKEWESFRYAEQKKRALAMVQEGPGESEGGWPRGGGAEGRRVRGCDLGSGRL